MVLLDSILKGASDAVFVADAATGKIVYANDSASEMFECAVNDLIGIHQSELHPKEDLEYISEKFREFVSSDDYKELKTRIITKSGKIKPVLITSANSFGEGDKKYVAAFFKNLSINEKIEKIAFQQSHMVRGPLSTIMGILNILDKNEIQLGENEKNILLKGLHEEAHRLDKQVKAVVEFAEGKK